jgi:hypothetical protein
LASMGGVVVALVFSAFTERSDDVVLVVRVSV